MDASMLFLLSLIEVRIDPGSRQGSRTRWELELAVKKSSGPYGAMGPFFLQMKAEKTVELYEVARRSSCSK